ncbi:uncharacterized protein [Periplaneta americana]|uniref:uncharacterized protein n=1 Tax=Periplaneta americana TaxID=6978 RepID=UPI0037E7F402
MSTRRSTAVTRIVAHVMDRNDVQAENWSLHNLTIALGEEKDKIKVLEWLAARNLIRNEFVCPNCKDAMSLIRRTGITDGYQWRCKVCKTGRSVRDGSYFTVSKLGLHILIRFIYCWARDKPQKDCALESGLGSFSTRTTVDWANFCREICEHWLEDHPCVVGGLDDNGISRVVEIDESKFFHRKYHRGLWRESHWVFGGIERETGKCFLVEVPDKTETTLTDVIQRFILPGTIIVSDGRAAYRNVSQIDGAIYEHRVIVAKRKFVDLDNIEIHMENVENLWMGIKTKIRKQYGTSEALFPSYLHEFLWRNAFRHSDSFSAFLTCISDVHHFN